MSFYPRRLRFNPLMMVLLVLALISEDAHAKWRFKFNIFGGGKTSSFPHSSPSYSAPSIHTIPSLPSLPDNVRLSYGGGYQSLPSVPAWPIGWNVPGKPQGPPPGFSVWNPVGGTHNNIYKLPPAFNPYFKSGTSKKSLPKDGPSSSSSGLDYGGLLPGFESRDRNNSKGDNGSSTGLGLGTGLITGALGGAILGHALTPTHNREVEHSGGGDNKTISNPTTSDEELDKTVITIEETWLPVANSAPRTRGTDIIKRNLTHPDDPSKTEEVEYWACFGPDDLNLAEQIFGSSSLISTMVMALLVSYCLN